MAKHRLTFHDLRRILASYGVSWQDPPGGGSHGKFVRNFPEGRYSYPVPVRREVLPCYVKGCRKKFRLLPEDGVSDDEFFSR
jgi:hypothetical protein